jgi:hypothetical protein
MKQLLSNFHSKDFSRNNMEYVVNRSNDNVTFFFIVKL